jgi:hypothetical protein
MALRIEGDTRARERQFVGGVRRRAVACGGGMPRPCAALFAHSRYSPHFSMDTPVMLLDAPRRRALHIS